MTPLAAGGVPPYGQDFNGILNFLSAAVRWAQAGGSYVHDAAFATAAGGYPRGAVLLKSGLNGIWLCTTENNTSNPDTGGAGWVDGYAAALSVGATTTATHAIQFSRAFGLGQTWIDDTASRAVGVVHTNSTGKPIMVSTSVTGSVANSTVAVALLVGSGPGLSSNSLVTDGTPGNWSLSCTGGCATRADLRIERYPRHVVGLGRTSIGVIMKYFKYRDEVMAYEDDGSQADLIPKGATPLNEARHWHS